jgi:hypothetical protein
LSGIGSLSKFEETGDNLKKKGEKEMYQEKQEDKAKFAEFCQLSEKRKQIEGEQKLYSENSVLFHQNKASLKKIRERLNELKEEIPETYFHPDPSMGINKRITIEPKIPSFNLEANAQEIFKLQDGIKDAAPGQAVGAMRERLGDLMALLGIRARHLQPQRTDRAGKFFDK